MAADQIHLLAQNLNESKKLTDSMTKVISIHSQISGWDFEVVSASRRYIFDEVVYLANEKGPHWLILFNDIFVLAKEAHGIFSFGHDFKNWKFEKSISILSSLAKKSEYDSGFSIVSQGSELLIVCSSQKQRDKWMEEIKSTVKLLSKEAKHKKEISATIGNNKERKWKVSKDTFQDKSSIETFYKQPSELQVKTIELSASIETNTQIFEKQRRATTTASVPSTSAPASLRRTSDSFSQKREYIVQMRDKGASRKWADTSSSKFKSHKDLENYYKDRQSLVQVFAENQINSETDIKTTKDTLKRRK